MRSWSLSFAMFEISRISYKNVDLSNNLYNFVINYYVTWSCMFLTVSKTKPLQQWCSLQSIYIPVVCNFRVLENIYHWWNFVEIVSITAMATIFYHTENIYGYSLHCLSIHIYFWALSINMCIENIFSMGCSVLSYSYRWFWLCYCTSLNYIVLDVRSREKCWIQVVWKEEQEFVLVCILNNWMQTKCYQKPHSIVYFHIWI